MARCIDQHNCGYHDESVVTFLDNRCAQCGLPQSKCPRCGEEEEHGCVCEDCRASVNEYAALAHVYDDALAQAANGKGKERHAEEGVRFEDQPIGVITRDVGIGFPIGQAIKKAKESIRLEQIRGKDAAQAELLGAMNYLAMAYLELGRK